MMLIMQILVVLGLGLVGYAVFGVFTTGKNPTPPKLKIQDPPMPAEDPGKDQKIQRLQSQVAKLESQLEESKVATAEEKSGLAAIKEKEAEFTVELKRREEWVGKAEAELAKVKTENADLNNKFAAKEKELEEEFSKNVNLTREIREMKAALEAKEMACRLKEDQLQVQKHQVESQLKLINEHAATIAEFSRKEKISEWVPKSEFNQLNEEYTKLEKELEASQERLKNFAIEIAHLRPAIEKKVQPVEAVKLPQALPEEIPPEKSAPEETDPSEANPEETKPNENKAVEENQTVEESKTSQEIIPQPVVPEEAKPEEAVKSEEDQAAEESQANQETIPQTAVPEKVAPEEIAKLEEDKAAEESNIAEDIKIVDENKAPQEITPAENEPEKKIKESPEEK
ncbi:MAG: hypothetical protein COV73_01080 [Candidatus Omnitrophica bacterium CG11_big_fil_rev_8_21_14_0_20_43_6]|nr:MAG: hypothetical protein COV73_01080 [Candidatus Omnitrophica bacterium CG11_big_fil_rev_8_21_14_0_20_43_6]